MNNYFIKIVIIAVFTLISVNSCNKEDNIENDFSLNLFSVDDDIKFGEQLKTEINGNPNKYPLLDESKYPEAYKHIRQIRDSVLNCGKIKYETKFKWEVFIIDDSTLNAFAAPGGYLYFYTGLIKFLDDESDFAGVMAHEMAHIDRRHSTDQLTKAYGIQILSDILLGKESGKIAEIAAGMASGLSVLAFSRSNEYEADEFAVKYLYETSYDALGIKAFFDKLNNLNTNNSSTPTFLSTHPSPEDRGDKIIETWTELGGKSGNTYINSYQYFKSTLP